MQHFYISNRLQNEVNSPCEIVVAVDGLDAATLCKSDAITVRGHPVGAVRRTIEGDVAYRSAGRSAHIQQWRPNGRCWLRFALLANGIALEVEGCREKEPFTISHNCYLFTFELSWHTRLRQRARPHI